MSEKISLDNLMTTYDAVEKARESDRPFPKHNEDGTISVIGDANQTELPKMDISLRFMFQKNELEEIPKDADVVGKYVFVDKVFKDIYVNPRENLKYLDCTVRLIPFYEMVERLVGESSEKKSKLNKLDPDYDKKAKKIEAEITLKMIHEYAYMEDDVHDALYDFVGALLNLDDFMKDHISAFSIVQCFSVIVINNPELFNEAELVFTH